MAECGIELFDRPVRLTGPEPFQPSPDQDLCIREFERISPFCRFTHDLWPVCDFRLFDIKLTS